mmetsp:Transcript_5942/g.11424  ORF Transcript_5942/g.11424 Transcript_5942/m.11424 type:complete len:413 (+) Transcript_5942:386-1624(+)
MASAQTRLDKAIVAAEQADTEVERLCDIVERAADALNKARQTKRAAQKELDEAANAANAASAASPTRHAQMKGRPQQKQQSGALTNSGTRVMAAPGALAARPRYSGRVDHGGSAQHPSKSALAVGRRKEAEQYADEPQSDYSNEESEEYSESESESESESDEGEDNDDEEEEGDGFDMGNEALEQIRYRLETAKIDPNSPDGTKILDKLLVRLQDSKAEVIDAQLVNEYIDELLFVETEGQESPLEITNGATMVEQNGRKPPPPQDPQQHPRIRISRGGIVLGWYQGQLDERGYAREGSGSMYYDAGHECHGAWQNDEMIGRGMYQWSDGHVYDGEWLNGKRHGLGRFIRPDNVVLYGRYEKGHHKGEGVRWSADRTEAQVVVDGVPNKTVSLAIAKKIATGLGFDDILPPV